MTQQNSFTAYFRDRSEAGQNLARFFTYTQHSNAVIYAIPNGGVAVAAEIAHKLNAPLDLIIVNKINNPYSHELALGAVAEDGHSVLSDEILTVDPEWINDETKKAIQQAKLRKLIYLKQRQPTPCSGKTAILVDDGIATGLTIKTSIKELKLHFQPKKIIVATPIASTEVVKDLRKQGVELVSILTLAKVMPLSSYYLHFPPITSQEVIKNLNFFNPTTNLRINRQSHYYAHQITKPKK